MCDGRGQQQREDCALARSAVHPQIAAHGQRQGAGLVSANAKATFFSGLKRFEQLVGNEAFGHPYACVDYVHRHLVALRSTGDVYRRSVGCRLNRVLHEMANDSFNTRCLVLLCWESRANNSFILSTEDRNVSTMSA